MRGLGVSRQDELGPQRGHFTCLLHSAVEYQRDLVMEQVVECAKAPLGKLGKEGN